MHSTQNINYIFIRSCTANLAYQAHIYKSYYARQTTHTGQHVQLLAGRMPFARGGLGAQTTPCIQIQLSPSPFFPVVSSKPTNFSH
jgi:hypothetical protein